LDFEKFWGVHDVSHPSAIAADFMKIDEAVERMLHLFNQYETHVTWASVGLLAHQNREELLAANETWQIPYAELSYRPFPLRDKKISSVPDSILLAPSMIRKIIAAPHQEFASHTYSHYYCLEKGQSAEDFKADITRMNEVVQQYGCELRSIVFPRNQVNTDYLYICNENGIRNFRGNQQNIFWRNSTFGKESFFKKIGRVLDAYFSISKTKGYTLNNLPKQSNLVNIPANRFLRPYIGNAFLENRKLLRIKNELYKAAKNGTVYHLWWHPHNFTKNIEASLTQLEEILAYVEVLKQKFGMVSLNMQEIGEHAR
jgi:peptidoglycan/xylan/chitin deacetylase (PgdA/CDA1 family)